MTASASLPELLAERGIYPKKPLRPGNNPHLVCPKCEGGRTREASLSIKVDEDSRGATWTCKRGTCGWADGARLPDAGSARALPRAEAKRPVRKPEPQEERRPPALYKFFAERGISEETVDIFGCYVTKRRFPDPIGEAPAIVFPYRHRGEVVNRKYRPQCKQPQMQERDALPTLFNADCLKSADYVWWVEGEPDVMAMYEAGYPATVTLKDGAPAELRAEDDPRRQDDKRFAALATHAEELAKVQRFILAGDNDEPGEVLREELARRLGRHKCWTVTWPEGCKDAGDVLRLHGAETLQEAVNAAKPYPIEGVQRLEGDTLIKLRHSKPPTTMTTGTAATDEIMRFPTEGRVIVVTGLPNAGKSAWVSHVLVHTEREGGRRWIVFSPEMQPWEQYAAHLAEIVVGQPFWPGRGFDRSMTDAEIRSAESWLAERTSFLVSDAESEPPTIDWLLARAENLVLRDGATDLLIDPFNELEHQRGGFSETEYIGRCLQRFRAFGLRHGVNIWIVAHPQKMMPPKPGAPIPVPGLYDIAGSAHWANKSDLGIVIHTPDNVTQVHVVKARFRRHGRKGRKAELEFDPGTGRYRSASVQGAFRDQQRQLDDL